MHAKQSACIMWRLPHGAKYADLNHPRPIREEAAAAKQGKAEKREGTPLAGSNSKARKSERVVFHWHAYARNEQGRPIGVADQRVGSVYCTPPSTASNGTPQHRCLACHRYGSGKVKECQTRVHEFHPSDPYDTHALG
jgi:hypothetical protein